MVMDLAAGMDPRAETEVLRQDLIAHAQKAFGNCCFIGNVKLLTDGPEWSAGHDGVGRSDRSMIHWRGRMQRENSCVTRVGVKASDARSVQQTVFTLRADNLIATTSYNDIAFVARGVQAKGHGAAFQPCSS